jgi:protease IV
MSEHDSGPGTQGVSSPTPVTPGVPTASPADFPAAPPTPPSQPAYPVQPPARRSRAGLWWALAIVLVVTGLIVSCALPLLVGRGKSAPAFGDAIAVIYLDRAIAGSGSSASFVTPESFYLQFKQAQENASVKAIILRVDSPGGTVAASEEIARYVAQSKKPVVASIGDIGASGAYMISSQTDEIWAMPGSAVGGIGVITEIPNVSGLLDTVGVDFQVITAGKYKDAGSPYRPLTKEEKALIQGEIDEAYRQFIGIVADGRNLPESRVESMATGWVWSGEKSIEMGLADKIGTFQEAKDAAARRGGIKGDYREVVYEEDLGDIFSQVLGVASRLSQLDALAGSARESTLRRAVPR